MKTHDEKTLGELRMIKILLIIIALLLTLIAGILNVEVLAGALAVVLALSLVGLPLIFILR